LITNFGKNILAKYLVGQTSSYASFIAIGVGPRPIPVGINFPDFSNQESLDFEVLRTPITSRGFVYDRDNKPQIVFLAELPTDQRYLISEVGIYSGRSNPSAGNLDSRSLYSFGSEENWEYHTENASSSIPTRIEPFLDQPGPEILIEDVVFRTNNNNVAFSQPLRSARFEAPRVLDRSMMVRGDMSFLEVSNGRLQIAQQEGNYFGSHIHQNGISINLDQNSLEDELRIAFSVINRSIAEQEVDRPIRSVRLLVEFASADIDNPSSFAKMEVVLNATDSNVDFSVNRYFVVKKKLEDLVLSPNFTWSSVSSVRVYATVIDDVTSLPSDKFYVCLDGIRFENTTIKNPLYGLSGYTVLKTFAGQPIIKESNTSNSVEFRFGLDL
jgi:hypothetical protein